jgi:hypothetical protein
VCLKWRRAGDISTTSLSADKVASQELPGALGMVAAGAIRAGGLARTNVEMATTLLGRAAARTTSSGCMCSMDDNKVCCTTSFPCCAAVMIAVHTANIMCTCRSAVDAMVLMTTAAVVPELFMMSNH